ncbi:MAG: hypothetical protein IJ460_04280 [Clostridia bacterium]|nr:hypothetical protein [Clostridia bacterium]
MICRNKDCVSVEQEKCTLSDVILDEEGKCIFFERRVSLELYKDGSRKEKWIDVDEEFLYE